MALQTLLLRFLLLAAFFNAAIGMPLHEAGHVRSVAAASATAVDVTRDEVRQDAGPESVEEGEGLHAWCATYAAQQTALVFAMVALRLLPALAPTYPQTKASFVHHDRQWRYSARDPPPAGH